MNFKRIVHKVDELLLFPVRCFRALDSIRYTLGRIESYAKENVGVPDVRSHEYKVFSRAGEDGIIQYLTRIVPIENKSFIEFGVQNYTESNTRFLVMKDNWSGLVIDGSEENINYLKNDPIYLHHNIIGVSSFVTAENINELFLKNGFSGDIGILSVDIDGVDYWVWKAIEVVNPRIVIVEYNSLFGDQHSFTVPYNPSFDRTKSHYSNLYFGASLGAFYDLGKSKGYKLVGCDSSGSNAFFVRNDLSGNLPDLTPGEAYVKCQFRQSRDLEGNLTFLSFNESLDLIGDMEIIETKSQQRNSIKNIIKPS